MVRSIEVLLILPPRLRLNTMKQKLDDLSDEALAALAGDGADPEGSRAAIELLLSRFTERIYRWCRRSTSDHETALDLSQEVLVKIHRSIGSFAGGSRVSTWVFTIVRNTCISHARRRTVPTEDDAMLERWIDPRPRPDQELLEIEAQAQLMESIREELDPIEQDALWMRCVDRVPVDEITRALGITSASGARGVLQSARRKLRAALDRKEGGGTR